MKVKPKKALGQHFLIDLTIAERIADTIEESYASLPVLEVGPGMGVLTKYLLTKGYDTRVVEIDRESVSYLKEYVPQLQGKIIEGDFLELLLENYMPEGYFTLIGNYPYNISSQIFFKLLEYRERIPFCSGMLQREVAQRLASPPGKKDYGILSVLLQAWYDVEYLFTVDEHVFSPPPKVKSGVIRLKRNQRKCLGCDERYFKLVVKTAFNQRRKMLRSSLKSLFGSQYKGYAQELFSKRPEQLSVEEFIIITQTYQEFLTSSSL